MSDIFYLGDLAMANLSTKLTARAVKMPEGCAWIATIQVENDGLCHNCRAKLWGEQSL
jgi:hypothetical protein